MNAAIKRKILFAIKLAVSVGVMVLLFRKVLARENAADLWARLADLSWGWIAVAGLAQMAAIFCGVIRWRLLLRGQGIFAPFRHLFGAWMIGRFFGAVTPGGLGLNGFRLYDIASRTGKTARATAITAIEMILGWLSFGAVVVVGSFFGIRYIGLEGVLLVDAFFVSFMVAAITLLSRPRLFRWIAERLPVGVRTRIRTLVDAVCAYQGKAGMLTQAVVLAFGVHAFNNFIYVGAARALGVELSIGEVFFVSSLQIFATMMPISIGGVGVREATAVALYTAVGVPAGVAVLIPIVGIAVEYSISAFGGPLFLARRQNYAPDIRVEDAERESVAHAEIPVVPKELWPKIGSGLAVGLAAGLLAGAIVGVAEGAAVLLAGRAEPDLTVLAYGAVAYGILLAFGGAFAGLFFALSGRLMRREAVPAPRAYARLAAAIVAFVGLALGAFRVRRDLFDEQLVWKSAMGLGVLLACVATALVVYLALAFTLRILTEKTPARLLLHPLGSLVAVALIAGGVLAFGTTKGSADPSASTRTRPAAPPQARNVLFLVVDTLRADHLPDYGYGGGATPHLEAFARDAIRFDQAFANSSWTRPSFASILTGRLASSHRVMSKADSLPDELITLPEALGSAGFATAGFVTNFNVAPFFNFQQGFDEYRYIEPAFVLGANDTASKLLLVQVLRRVVERMQAARPGTAYQDAETVNRELGAWLDRSPEAPFFAFVGYMDPHDPYFEHPYSGVGYSRAANQNPKPEEAPRLRALYDGEITYWDAEFGKLVADLKRRGLYDEMTIVITSDHGEEFMDHGGYWHGTTLYDEQVRVPLYVKLPFAEKGGSVIRHWVQSIDIMPTLLRLQGVEIPEGVQGGDLFKGTDEVYAEESHEGNVLESLRTRRGLHELKMIRANAGNPRGLPETELFRVDLDPRELVNLEGELPEETAIAKGRLDLWNERAVEGAVERRAIDSEADPDAVARLRALGYAGGE